MDGIVRYVRELVPIDQIINEANPRTHLSFDFGWSNPLRFGIQVFPPRTYEILRELKEKQSHGNDPESREQHPEAPGAA